MENRKRWFYYLPMLLVELYLVGTLLLMELGPIDYNLYNVQKFWILILSYHVAFIVGYIWSMKRGVTIKEVVLDVEKIQKLFWVVLILEIIVWIVVYRNSTHANSYIPYELPGNFIKGLIHPAERYYWKLTPEARTQFHGNPLVTGFASILYPFYYCMPALMVFLWDKIAKKQKIVAYLEIILIMMTGISVATNKFLFDMLFLIGGSFAIETIIRWKKEGGTFFAKRKILIFTIIFLCIFDMFYFTYNLRDRTGNNISYVGDKYEDVTVTKKTNEVEEGKVNKKNEKVENEEETFLDSMLIALESYICQGYYGFSLALDEEFTSTYGLGHSEFCISTIKGLFGIDLGERTYQEKITDKWSRTSNWHSFYSQIANDVGFYGVILVMFVIGIICSQVWKDTCEKNNVLAKCLLMLFVIMFLYMPANNQLGNMYGTFFCFWELLLAWIAVHIYQRRKIGK